MKLITRLSNSPIFAEMMLYCIYHSLFDFLPGSALVENFLSKFGAGQVVVYIHVMVLPCFCISGLYTPWHTFANLLEFCL